LLGSKVWSTSGPSSSWCVAFDYRPFHVRLLPFTKVIICSLSEWQKEKQLRILDDKKEERSVKVIRCSEERDIDAKDLLVGDIALFEPGEIIPCGGVFISGHNVTCDESGATGKSDAIKKASYDDRVALRETANGQGFDAAHTGTDCFMVPGSKVLDGHGKYVVIAVGQKSFNGRVTMGTSYDHFRISRTLA
jgi:Ca2+-transporting ATPase